MNINLPKQFLKVLKKLFNLESFNECAQELLFLCNSDALPTPLESEEELELILKNEQGNEEAKTKLIEHNLRLVVYIAKKFENTGIDVEDLISIGSVGLIKAIESFNLEKNIKLATFASRCIENEILMYLRKLARHKNELSLDEPLTSDSDGNELVLADIISTENDGITETLENNVEKKLLYKFLNKLSSREKQIMCMRYGLGEYSKEQTQKEVADLLGISQSYISRIEKKVLCNLKIQMNKLM